MLKYVIKTIVTLSDKVIILMIKLQFIKINRFGYKKSDKKLLAELLNYSLI